jgi:MtfA peptidase
MPRDTVWINNFGNYIIAETNANDPNALALFSNPLDSNSKFENISYSYNPKNSTFADSILQRISVQNSSNFADAYITEKNKSDDKIFGFIESVVLLIAILAGYYAYRRAKKYKENPFAEDERDWVEIGATPRNNFGHSLYENSIIFSKPAPKQVKEYFTYNGRDLKFSEGLIIIVLKKHFAYFNALDTAAQKRFLIRHKRFMRSKIFKIHTRNGFKEMPILISATAIQLSFGLDKYMLPFYQYIHIFPQEFLGVHPTIRFLEGNVSGNSINISWKHYLKGYETLSDGQNLGLHEFAHAYQAQNFSFEGTKDKNFISGFSHYTICSNKIFENEKVKPDGLYTDYAFKNFQEFWAESVEIFFEKPTKLLEQYPELYDSMCKLLNQVPIQG